MRLTVRQNLSVFAQLYAVADIDERIAELAADLELTEFLDRPTGKLSAGQKTRVSLAKALLNQPGSPAARRADRLARSRHRRLGARPARALSPRAGRDRAARLAQHDRGRAAVRARHHHEDGPHRGRRHAGPPARPLRPRDAGRGVPRRRARARRRIARRRNDRQRRRPRLFRQPRRRHGAALLVSAALVLAARARPDLLADGADADVGLPAALRVAERRPLRARRRRVHRRGAAVGHPVPRPARIFDLVPRGNVVAQSRQPDDVAAAAGRVHRRADDHEHRAPG